MQMLRYLALTASILVSVGTALAAPAGEDFYHSLLVQDIPKIKAQIQAGADVNYKANGRPMLVWAGQSNNVEIVKILLDGKADVNGADEGLGHTALMRAVETQSLEVTKVLLSAKADPNAEAANGESVLFMAIKTDKPEFVEALVQAGADAKKLSKDGDSPALIAAQNNMEGSPKIIRILAKAGADLDAANAAYSPLGYALQQGSVDIVAALLEGGANPNAKSPMGRTMLEFAEKAELVDLLIKAKADPNAIGDSGSTPLTRAIENGDLAIVTALVKGGADPNKADQYGNLPLKVANNYSKTDIEEFLKKNGATAN